MKTDNPSTLRKYLVAHNVYSSKVGDANDAAYEIHIDRTGGSTWEWNPLVNLAARQVMRASKMYVNSSHAWFLNDRLYGNRP